MAGKGKAKNIIGKTTNTHPVVEVNSLDYWRAQARAVAPKEQDEWRISEIATALNDVARLLGTHWRDVNTILEGNSDKTVSVGFSIQFHREAQTKRHVSCKISYNQKFSEALNGEVPDPDQTELPLQTSSSVPDPEPEEAAA